MEKNRRARLIAYIVLALCSAAFVISGINTSQNKSAPQKNIMPTDTPEISFVDAVLCKAEFDGLKKMSEKTGASGMLIMDRIGLETGICQFYVKKIAYNGGTGNILMTNDPKGKDYGIKLLFDSSDEKQLFDWSKTALLYFNKEIDESTAETAIQTALAEGSTVSDLFTIRSYSDIDIYADKVTPMKIIEIHTP